MKKDRFEPMISVIVPVYNSELYIEKCINSILKQDYTNYEIIIINDGSTDDSEKVIRKITKTTNKIRYYKQKNSGVAKTRNNGIEFAKGEYIAFIDNDDYIDPDYFKVLIDSSKSGDADIVLCGYRRPDENGKIIKELHITEHEWTKFLITAPWAKVYKKEYIVKNGISFLDNNIGEDVFFNLQAFLETNKIETIDYIGYNWFFNTNSISNSVQKDYERINVFRLLNECINILKKKKLLNKKRDYIELFFYRYIIWFLLFSCKKHSYKEISKIYDELFNWLKTNFPNYKNNKLIGINSPKGETKPYQLLYWGFLKLHKLHLGKLFVFAYSKI